jgi:FlgD Ig-like domain
MRWIWTVMVGVVAGLIGTTLALGLGHQVNASNTAFKTQVPLLGSTVSNTAQLAQNTAEFGHMPIIHVYFKGLPPKNAWTSGPLAANHSAVVVSFNASPSQISSGRDNAVLAHFFDTAPRGHAIYWSYIHEPEHEIVRGQFSTAAYKAAWPHVAALARAAHNPYLKSTLILMAYDLLPGAHRNWKSYMPGGGIISTLGWDAYPPGGRTPLPPQKFMAPAAAVSKSVGLPFGFAEFGMCVAKGRAAWLNQVGSYLLKSGAVFGTLFDSAEVTPNFKVTDHASTATWRRFVHASVMAHGSGGGPPPPPKKHHHKHKGAGLHITGLTMTKRALKVSGRQHTTIKFHLNAAATVSVLVLNADGTVTHEKTLAVAGAGPASMDYLGYAGTGHPQPAGRYKVLVVATNSHTTTTAQVKLTIVR